MSRRTPPLLPAALVALAAMWTSLAVASPALAAVEGTHFFDPALSLTGDCSSSAATLIDTVPDPGLCPMPPGVAGVDHPSKPFNNPKAIVTDSYGNIYVSIGGFEYGGGGAIDIFNPAGRFITEIADSLAPGPIAVDSQGNLYVANSFGDDAQESLVRYVPTAYEPASGNIRYDTAVKPPVVLAEREAASNGLAVNPANDHLFRRRGNREIVEYSSAAEGNAELGLVGEVSGPQGLAVDAAHGRLYATSWEGEEPCCTVKVIKVFELAAPHNLLFRIEPSAIPGGKLTSSFPSVAADEGSGHVFLYAGDEKKVYEFDQNGNYVSTLEHSFQHTYLSQIGIDNGAHSPNGALDPDGRYLFVPSHPSGVGHVFAFQPKPVPRAPEIEALAVEGVTEDEAVLTARVNPKARVSSYRFEYTSQESFDNEGFSGATLAGEGSLPALIEGLKISAPLAGLAPNTGYRFRLLVHSEAGDDEREGGFKTYRPFAPSSGCANEALREGLSAALPDCRAYELVTPSNTNGHYPIAHTQNGLFFAMRQMSPAGNAVSFLVEGGAIPGFEGTSGLHGDPYLATRGTSGWGTEASGPTGAEVSDVTAGGQSSDQGYLFWEDESTFGHLRYPDGHSELLGQGSIATDPMAQGVLIGENGKHIVFVSRKQLEPDAPPGGTSAIYDRTPDGVTHVVSLLPEEVPPAAGENATYAGASPDGKGIAFKVAGKLYLRYNDDETFEVGEGLTFEGIAEGGARLFYLKGGDLYAFDVRGKATTRFTEAGNVTVVNVSADGSSAYFVSPVAGEENLYRSHEGEISFVGTLNEDDVNGKNGGIFVVGALGIWSKVVGVGQLAEDPSRTTPAGSVLLFESSADLAGYDPEGHREVYRYDADGETLSCLSCNPTTAKPTGESNLQSTAQGGGSPEPLNTWDTAVNISPDGNRAVFESTEALVAADVDGRRDVYEWEEAGVGSCRTEGGCVYLISSGESGHVDYLYGMSEDGDDVFFLTADLLLPGEDPDETPSLYDARVGGGFPPPPARPGGCLGEACQPAAVAPSDPTPASSSFEGAGNPVGKKRCLRAKRAAKRAGKSRCAQQRGSHAKKHRGRFGAKGKGGR